MAKNFDDEPIFMNSADASMFDFAYPAGRIFQADTRWTYGREPVLRRMPDGSWLCLIYSGGKREPSRENCVLITRSSDDGQTWSAPQILFDHAERCVWATELFTEGPQPTIFFQTFVYDTFYLEIKTFYSTSDDSGRTWSEPRTVPGVCSSVSVRKGITLADGTLLLPVYWTELLRGFNWDKNLAQASETDTPVLLAPGTDWKFCCGIWRSTDSGQTWSQHGYIPYPGADSWGGAWEPNVVQLSSGRLAMLIRVNGTGSLWRSDSDDLGLTWSPIYRTDIPNPGSKFDILTINNRIILLHNPDSKVRNPLSLWVSSDDMQTWHKKIDLIHSRRDGHWICYPHAVADHAAQTLYVASDAVKEFYLQIIPYGDFLS